MMSREQTMALADTAKTTPAAVSASTVLRLAASHLAALDEVERLRAALTLIERLYYMEARPAEWRAAKMNGVARDAHDGKDLAPYRRLFPRAALEDRT